MSPEEEGRVLLRVWGQLQLVLGICLGTLQSCLFKKDTLKSHSKTAGVDLLMPWGSGLISWLWLEAPFLLKAFFLDARRVMGLLLQLTGQGGLPVRASFRVISASPTLVFSL